MSVCLCVYVPGGQALTRAIVCVGGLMGGRERMRRGEGGWKTHTEDEEERGKEVTHPPAEAYYLYRRETAEMKKK